MIVSHFKKKRVRKIKKGENPLTNQPNAINDTSFSLINVCQNNPAKNVQKGSYKILKAYFFLFNAQKGNIRSNKFYFGPFSFLLLQCSSPLKI